MKTKILLCVVVLLGAALVNADTGDYNASFELEDWNKVDESTRALYALGWIEGFSMGSAAYQTLLVEAFAAKGMPVEGGEELDLYNECIGSRMYSPREFAQLATATIVMGEKAYADVSSAMLATLAAIG